MIRFLKNIGVSLKQIWADLGRSIFVGDRLEKNMRGIAIGAALIIVMNLITGTLNYLQGNVSGTISSLVLILFFSFILFFILVMKKRDIALTLTVVAMVIIYSYDVVKVTNQIMPLWTLLFPWAFCYLVSVRVGIGLSAYFTGLYLTLFYSPLKQYVAAYPSFILERFPIIYAANAFLCIYIMVQYHRNTLNQMDYAKQLAEAKASAEFANTAKSDFLANMSHEIRTPINAVLGMNEMVLRESLQARDQAPKDRPDLRNYLTNISNYAGNIDSAGKNLLAIINDILDFSKIESGKMEITEGEYKISSVLNDISNIISFKAKDKGLDFRIDVDSDLPDGLLGDEVRLRQIMTNLLNNAVKYTKEGSVTLLVSKGEGETVTEGGVIHLKIAVKDTGIGIKKEDLQKLFEKFERVDLKQNSTVEGSGLGLAITKNLLGLMGGTIEVDSVYGIGSVFTAVLPQKVVSTEPVGDFREKFEKSVQEAKVYHESFRAPDAHILIVDDTRMNLTVATGLLKKTQIEIDTASSGAEAIELTKTIRYDLILMDQRMPGMDGTEAMKHIKAQENGANAGTPFICLTADAVSGARKHYLAEGFTDYLTKPIDSKALETMLKKYLPAEKVLSVSEEGKQAPAPAPAATSAPAQPAADGFDRLRAVGIDPAVGLRFCQDDEDLYSSILSDYAQSSDEKKESLACFFAAEDWKNYAIYVHALKSTSKTIGAAELSEIAQRLEAAANAGDGDAIRGEHDDMMNRYEKTVAAIRAAEPDAEASASADDGVLEFAPEQNGDALEFNPE